MSVALVAGGSGFVGSHLCERLLAEDHGVICYDNLITGFVHLALRNVKLSELTRKRPSDVANERP